MATGNGIREGIYQNATVRRLANWLNASAHPSVVCEVAPDYVAAARWSRTGTLDGFAVEPLSSKALGATAVETNLLGPDEVRHVVHEVLAHLHVKGQAVALLVPDPVIRVFVLHFDQFPRSRTEAVPLLRWRLKKSVPFEADETLISFMRQTPRDEGGVDIVTALARLRIVREYEQLLESAGMSPGVVMSSTLAAIPLLDDRQPALLARVAGKALTTAIVRGGALAGYRCTELPSERDALTPQMLLDEIYPLAAYYQDSWSEGIAAVRLAGLGERVEEFRAPLESELHCPVGPLLGSQTLDGRLGDSLRPLITRGLDALVGWSLNRGA